MRLKFQVADELVATSYSFTARKRGTKSNHICAFQTNKQTKILTKKIRKKEAGGNDPKCRCLLVTPEDLVVFGRVSQESSRGLWGAESF